MSNIILAEYDAIIISISGGKDSQTILDVVMRLAIMQKYGGDIIAIHADTGAEWNESLPHCRMLCDHYNIPLHIALPFRALPDHIERRCMMFYDQGRQGAGWPSADCRYCTSDCKRAPIQKEIRHEFPALKGKYNLLEVTGERRQESRNRAKLPEFDTNKALTTRTRTVINWRPILDYTLDDVWDCIKVTGLKRHIAYDLGNERLSCAICVLASENDIRNGATARPDIAERFLKIERETGQTFRHKKSLAEILHNKPEVQSHATI